MIFKGKKVTMKSLKERIQKEIVPNWFKKGPIKGDDLDFMQSIFALHPDYEMGEESICCETDAFMGKSYGFFLAYKDGRVLNLSYRRALGEKKDWVVAAARQTINPQVREFRMSGNHHGLHIDHHVTPFKTLWSDFKNTHQQLDFDVSTCGPEAWFSDPLTTQLWSEYHKKHAQLRAITPEENLKLGAHGK